jgi:MFS family permease
MTDTTRGPASASRERATVLWVYASGIAAGISVGRFIAVEPQVGASFHLSSAQTALLLSAVTAVAAALALPVAVRVKGADLGRTLGWGLLILLLAGLVQAAAPTSAVVYPARVVEGAGYLLVTVTGPMVLSASCTPAVERWGLALWSTFIPVGIAAAAALGGVADTTGTGWRFAAGLTVLPSAVAFVGVKAKLAGIDASGDRPRTVRWSAPAFRLSLAFCLVALLGVSMLSLLPRLAAERGVSPDAGSLTATAVSLASVPGGLLAGRLMSVGWRPQRLAFAALAIPCAAACAFIATWWWSVSVGAVLLLIDNGLILGVMYASVPLVARSPRSLAFGYGLLIQTGSLGTLLGPPSFTVLISHLGWGAAVLLTAVLTLLSLASFNSAFTKRPGTA